MASWCAPELIASSRLRRNCRISTRDSGAGSGSAESQECSRAAAAETRCAGSHARAELSNTKPASGASAELVELGGGRRVAAGAGREEGHAKAELVLSFRGTAICAPDGGKFSAQEFFGRRTSAVGTQLHVEVLDEREHGSLDRRSRPKEGHECSTVFQGSGKLR